MRRALLLVAVLSVFMHVGVANASGPVGSVPPPQYPNWGCTGTCNSSNGDWSLTAGSSMVTNVASLYTNENVVIDVNDLVVPSNACIDITVDTLHICTSSNGLYPWTFSNVSGSYHQIQIFCSTSCQGNYLVSVLPISAPSPTPTPNPSFTATPTPLVPPTVTPPSVPRITHTPTVSPTPCVINAWGCDQPATATYVACESGIVVNYGTDPCITPSATPTNTPSGPTPTRTATPPPGASAQRDCGTNVTFINCNMWDGLGSSAPSAPPTGWFYYSDPQYGCMNGNTYGSGSYPGTDHGWGSYAACYGNGSLIAVAQSITLPFTGHICWQLIGIAGSAGMFMYVNDASGQESFSGTGTWCMGHEDTAGSTLSLQFNTVDELFNLVSVWEASPGSNFTPTVGPTSTPTVAATGTAGPTWTPRPTFTPTRVASPTNTPIGFVAPTATILANIDTCLGTIQDCNLALTPIAGKIGGIPGLIATPMAPLNTSVFSPFQTIGITRGGCLSFGKLPVVVPHIIWLASPVPVRGGPTATPNISGYVPISVTWTLPTVVGTPMRQGNFGPVDPLEFEPCNDPAIPTWGWDLSWNSSTFFEWVGFFVWTIALIRRIFG